MSSMWAAYLKEREEKETIEWRDGFVVFKVNDDRTCYIENIYVVPQARGTKVASQLCDAVALIAKERGCTHLLGSVKPGCPGDTHSLKVQLSHGFRLRGLYDNLIILDKEI